MNLTLLSEMVALLLALSLTTERLVLIIRTPIKFLNNENPDPQQDKLRRFLLQALSYICACFTAGFLAKGNWSVLESVEIGAGISLPIFLVAVLTMGGSSLWKNILGYTKAVRGIRDSEKKKEEEKIQLADRRRKLQGAVPRMESILQKIEGDGQPDFAVKS